MNTPHDHTAFRAEVEQRWGATAYTDGDTWWRSMAKAQREAWQADSAQLRLDWQAAVADGEDPSGEVAQLLASRQAVWLSEIPGTPGYGLGGATNEYLLGLGDMYVADERFAAHYGGVTGATFVRDALAAFVAAR